MIRHPLLVCALLLAVSMQFSGAAAQQILLDGVSEGAAQNDRRRFVPEDSGQEDSSEAAAEPAMVMLPLRPLVLKSGDTRVYRMSGQYDVARFGLFLPYAMDDVTLNLSTRSAIDVLPARSTVEVVVNGTAIGTVTPDNFERAQTDRLPIPAGVLTEGRNVVTLTAKQVHRVFCGPDAAFSIWTEIGLGTSGIEMRFDDMTAGPLGFLAAAVAQLARDMPLDVHMADDDFSLAEAAPLIDRFEGVFGPMPPEISIEDYYAVTSGASQLARITVLPPGMVMPEGPRFLRGGDGALVLMLERGDLARAGEILSDALPKQPASDVLATLEPGRLTPLSDLGVEGVRGYGRYIQENVPFLLPQNWLLLASQEGVLQLDWRFDTGLPQGGLLLVKMNNTTIRLLALDEPENAGRPLPTLRIPFRANLLQPGANRLTFEALVPGDPPDQACVPREAPIFEVSGGTRLYVPTSPSMSLPGIDRTLADVGRSSIDLSDSAGELLPLGLFPRLSSVLSGLSVRNSADRARLTIGVPSDLDALSGDVVDGHLSELAELFDSDDPEPVEQGDAWSRLNEDSWLSDVIRRENLSALPEKLAEWVRAIWTGTGAGLSEWLSSRSAEAIFLQPDMQRPDEIWLILKPGTDYQHVVASLAETRQTFQGPKAQVSVFSPLTGWESWQAPNRPLRLHEALTPGNARAVVGNFVTIIPGRFIAPLLALTALASVIALAIAVMTRRKPK